MNRLQKMFTIGAILIITMYLLYFQHNMANSKYGEIRIKKSFKKILYWTPMFHVEDFGLGLGSKIFQNCPQSNCYATSNKTQWNIEEFDAIIFHAVEYKVESYGKPPSRQPHQLYIFSIQESPKNTPEFISKTNNFYNWTMTYRWDSDIIRPYGFLKAEEIPYKPPSIEKILQRPMKIAWFVSNCATSSKRELIYNSLTKFLPVDVFGQCNNVNYCPRSLGDACYRMLATNYKFYLSFENSLCEDYVTEKLYNLLKFDIVPIVFGGANYTKIAPPHSVIDVRDFKNVKSLASYIKFVDENPKEYLKFFEWKKHFRVDTSNSLTLCTLCRKLNEPIVPKIYKNIVEWWRGPNFDKCSTNFLNNWL